MLTANTQVTHPANAAGEDVKRLSGARWCQLLGRSWPAVIERAIGGLDGLLIASPAADGDAVCLKVAGLRTVDAPLATVEAAVG